MDDDSFQTDLKTHYELLDAKIWVTPSWEKTKTNNKFSWIWMQMQNKEGMGYLERENLIWDKWD